MAERPVIGITCYVEDIDRDPWVGQRSAVLPQGYVDHVTGAGGISVILPPRLDVDPGMAAAVLDRVDGLIIAGGADIESSRYGASAHPTSQSPRPDRDSWEIALVQQALARELPLLGICRGMQIMAVEAGGALEQHLPERVGHGDHCLAPGVYARHPVAVMPDTALAAIIDAGEHSVPTYHHQGVLAESLAGTAYVISAWHADGTPEAMEDPSARFRMAVQWHPEAGEDPRLFQALIAASR